MDPVRARPDGQVRVMVQAARATPELGESDSRARAVFNVENSLTGRVWRARSFDDRSARAIAERHDIPFLIGRILAARGVGPDDLPDFLEPTLRASMPDPSSLRDMDKAAARIADAVQSGEPVAVFADYDVDGAASAALFTRYMAELGLSCSVHVPDRIREGYGPNPEALMRFVEAGARLIVTVDCGVSGQAAFSAIEGAADIVVLDHHQAGETLPNVSAVINPNRQDDLSGLGYLAAGGVVFLALVAVNRELRRRGVFKERAEPDLVRLLPLVALATVCDVVPLVGLNRALVAQGLKLLARRENRGLVALGERARMSGPASVYQLGFVLGPRINAGGADRCRGSRVPVAVRTARRRRRFPSGRTGAAKCRAPGD